MQTEKDEVKLSLFTDDMIMYIENPKDPTKKLLDLLNEFGKVEYKINILKYVTFLCTNNELAEREIEKTIQFPIIGNFLFPIIIIKNNNIPKNKLNQGDKRLYSEVYRRQWKATEKDTNK